MICPFRTELIELLGLPATPWPSGMGISVSNSCKSESRGEWYHLSRMSSAVTSDNDNRSTDMCLIVENTFENSLKIYITMYQ